MPYEFTETVYASAGFRCLTPLYDLAIGLVTREQVWHSLLIQQISPESGDRIVDVGCGTGSLAIRLKSHVPAATVIAIDPDPSVLRIARRKAARLRIEVDWREGFLTQSVAQELGPIDKVVSSLVFHQVPLVEKSEILESIRALLVPGGQLHIADYGQQRSTVMRVLFRSTVQLLDGVEDTRPNADGRLLELIRSAGFAHVRESLAVPTLTGSVSLYRATAPDTTISTKLVLDPGSGSRLETGVRFDQTMKIGDRAYETDVPTNITRYYERHGMVAPERCGSSGYTAFAWHEVN